MNNNPNQNQKMQEYDVDEIINKLLQSRKFKPGYKVQLEENEIKWLCYKSRDIFMSQPILLELEAPINICGDIHGQYYDMLRLFEYGGYPPESNYLFLGDYVDRGQQSIEAVCLLLAYKIKFPDNFFMTRGNHECASINRIYGFYDECKKKYSVKLWKIFTDCFNCLPVAALLDDRILCMHGGLSSELEKVEQIKNILRPSDVPEQGLLCDLLWSDPEETSERYGANDRGVSVTFGPKVVEEFEFFAGRQLVTVFSAPNYCGEFDNSGAMMKIDENLICSFQILKPMTELANINVNNDPKQQKLPRGVTPPKGMKKQNQQQQQPPQAPQ